MTAYVDDKYKNNPTVADRYYSETWKNSTSIQPLDGEQLSLYVKRLARVIHETEETAHCHIKWHTHQSAGQCWICVQIQSLGLIYNILADIAELSTSRKLTFPIKHD